MVHVIDGRCCKRHASRRPLPCRCTRDTRERKLCARGRLRSSDQLAYRRLAYPQPVRDCSVAHPLALEHVDAANVCPRYAAVRDANPARGRALPSHLAHSGVDSAARCAPSGQMPVPPLFVGQSPSPPRTPLHKPRRPHRRRIVMHGQSGDDDHALIRLNSQAAARIDHHGIRRRR